MNDTMFLLGCQFTSRGFLYYQDWYSYFGWSCGYARKWIEKVNESSTDDEECCDRNPS